MAGTPPPARGAPSSQPPASAISVRWLAGALAGCLVLAGVAAYAALCLLFYQGQWQLVYRPSVRVSRTPADAGLPFEPVRFDYTEQGQPQLTGWWIPAAPGARYPHQTILLLHGADGSLSDTLPRLQLLHSLGINLFAIDYRGYGASAGPHPNETRSEEDALAAWSYLTDRRHLLASTVVAYGEGTGASFATYLASQHALGGLILEDISPTAREIYRQDARARLVPLAWLATEKLDPRPELATLSLPKLFLRSAEDRSGGVTTQQCFRAASAPKQYADLRRTSPQQAIEALSRFLDELPH